MEVDAGMTLVKVNSCGRAEVVCEEKNENEFKSDGFTFDFSQIQCNADFSSHLRDKFKLWLNAGKHLLEFGLSEQGLDFAPFTDNQKILLNGKINQLTPANEKQGTLAWVLGSMHNQKCKTDQMYLKYLEMLDALVEKIQSCQKQLDRFEIFDDVTPTNASSLTEFVIAMSHHNEVRQMLIVTEKEQKKEKSKLFCNRPSNYA
jgi:hypothetical protein